MFVRVSSSFYYCSLFDDFFYYIYGHFGEGRAFLGEEREERLGWDFGVWTGVGTEGGLMLRLFDKDVKFV